MFKFMVFGVLLCLNIREISGSDLTDTAIPAFPSNTTQQIFISDDKDENSKKSYNFHASQQIFYLNGPSLGKARGLSNLINGIDKELSSDYIVTSGIGAHKLHRRSLTWKKARRICIDEGGHLAVIRSDSEEKIMLQIMLEQKINEVWIGLHDYFDHGDWTSVLDEPLGETGWSRWLKKTTTNPDNYQGQERCVYFVRKDTISGMEDANCEWTRPFFCKISAV